MSIFVHGRGTELEGEFEATYVVVDRSLTSMGVVALGCCSVENQPYAWQVVLVEAVLLA
jgi:hypothetical protein